MHALVVGPTLGFERKMFTMWIRLVDFIVPNQTRQ